MKKLIEERNKKVVQGYEAGLTRQQIAESANITPHRVNALLRQLVPNYSFKREYKTPEHLRKNALAYYHKTSKARKKTKRINAPINTPKIKNDISYLTKLNVQF